MTNQPCPGKSGAPPLMRWVGLLVTGWIVVYLVESIGNAVFTGPAVRAFGIVAAVPNRETGPGRIPEERVAAGRDRLRVRFVRSRDSRPILR